MSLFNHQGRRRQRARWERRVENGNGTKSDEQGFCTVFDQPYPFNDEQYGWSVAISHDGCRIAIGTADDPGVVYLFDNTGTLMRLIHSPAASWLELPSSHYFGYSIALNCDGSRLVVGSHGANRAYLYDTNTGRLLQTYYETDTPTTIENDSFFGYSVDIDCAGTKVVVGDPNGQVWQAKYAGKAYLYDASDGGGEALLGIYHSPSPFKNGNFGISVALNSDGSRLVVGAWQDGHGESGSAYLWDVSDEAGSLLQSFSSQEQSKESGGKSKWFGYSVDISCRGDKVLIGSRGGDSKVEDAGAVYLFSSMVNNSLPSNGTLWKALHTIEAPQQVKGYQFGATVSCNCDCDQILIGSYGDGSAHLFRIPSDETVTENTAPTLRQSWEVPVNRNYIGAAVALSGNGLRAVLGAPRAHGDDPNLDTAGAAYLACLDKSSTMNSGDMLKNTNMSSTPPFVCSIPQSAYDKDAYLDGSPQMLVPALLVVLLVTMAYLHCHGTYWDEIIRQRLRANRSPRASEYEGVDESEVELTLLENEDS